MQTDHQASDNGTLNQALNKVLQDQQEQKSWIVSCQKLVHEQQEKLAALEQQVAALTGKPAASNTVSLEVFHSGVEDLKKTMEAQSKTVLHTDVHQRNFFPPSWKAGEFKIVFETIVKGMGVLIVLIWAIWFISSRW
jgi:hypothetical protein